MKLMIAIESKAESAIKALTGKQKSFWSCWQCGIKREASWTLAGLVSSETGSSDRTSVITWLRYPQKNCIFLVPDEGKVAKTPKQESGSPLGLTVLTKRSLATVLRLFCLTLAKMGHESLAMKLPEICLRSISCFTKFIRINCRTGLGVSFKKVDRRSTLGMVCRLKPIVFARDIFSFRIWMRSMSPGRLRRFLYMRALSKAGRDVGFRPVEAERFRRGSVSRPEKRSSYLVRFLDKNFSGGISQFINTSHSFVMSVDFADIRMESILGRR